MTFITLQVGQCGNQLGNSFFNTISDIANQKITADNFNFLEETQYRLFFLLVFLIINSTSKYNNR